MVSATGIAVDCGKCQTAAMAQAVPVDPILAAKY
jgi:bacterioferritin-associated ferredoxin